MSDCEEWEVGVKVYIRALKWFWKCFDKGIKIALKMYYICIYICIEKYVKLCIYMKYSKPWTLFKGYEFVLKV